MDYELKIRLLEKEAAHLREMQELARQRQDTTDQRLDKIQDLLLQIAQANNETAKTVKILADKVDQFVEAVLHRGGNGKA